MNLSRARALVLVVITTLASACSDAITAPETRVSGAAPSYDGDDDGPLPPNASQAEMPAQANSMVDFPYTGFGVAYTEPTYVEVTVTGLISAYYGPNEDRFGEAAGQFWQAMDPRGWWNNSMNNCGLGVTVKFSISGSVGFCTGNNNVPLEITRSLKTIGKGSPQMYRNKGPWLAACNDATYGPCFEFTGSQSITVKPTADKLVLVASASEVQALEEVTFTASTTNGAAFTIRDWTWVPDQGPIVVHRGRATEGPSLAVRRGVSADLAGGGVACVITNPVCTDSVINTGTMYVRAWVVNKIEQAEARVEVVLDRLIVTPSATSVTLG